MRHKLLLPKIMIALGIAWWSMLAPIGLYAASVGSMEDSTHNASSNTSSNMQEREDRLSKALYQEARIAVAREEAYQRTKDSIAGREQLYNSSRLMPVHIEQPVPGAPPQEFQFLAFYYNQMVTTNIYSENPFTGEVIGRFFGDNQSTTGGPTSTYFEQRLQPFFIYQPKLFNGRAILRAAFELDWTWGDEAYLVGGNRGGGFNGSRVNLQTQNIEIEIIPATGWAINFGLLRLFDTPYNPYRVGANTLLNTGYRLAFWGNHATGINVRYDADRWRFKTGFYQLYELLPERDDDVTLTEVMVEYDVTPSWRQGFSAWYLYDRANAQAGIPTIGEGFTSALPGWNGTYRLPIRYTIPDPFGATPQNRHRSDILWLGTFFASNPEFTMGQWGMSGYINANMGSVQYFDATINRRTNGEPIDTVRTWKTASDIFGVAANLRFGYKYGQTPQDLLLADMLYTTGDKDGIADGKYNGVVTGNTFGFPGAINVGHASYLVFPHGNVINRYMGAVSDISNMGLGVTGIVLSAERSIIPNRLNTRIGTAMAWSNVASTITTGTEVRHAGTFIGYELNARVVYNLGVLMSIEFHTAYMWMGDFYSGRKVLNDQDLYNRGTTAYLRESGADRARNPWTAFIAFRWLMF